MTGILHGSGAHDEVEGQAAEVPQAHQPDPHRAARGNDESYLDTRRLFRQRESWQQRQTDDRNQADISQI